MKKIVLLIFFIAFLGNGMGKEGIVIVANPGPEILTPLRERPLICDEVVGTSTFLAYVALAGTTIYGYATHPTGFDDYGCSRKYWGPIYEESKLTNFPCKMEAGFRQCIDALVEKQCAADKIKYDREFPDKQIAAWVPLMVAGAATIGFQGGWLLGKWIARRLNRKSRIPFRPAGSTAIEMEEV